MQTDYERTAKAIEVTRQRKYERWASEMREHGWTCDGPTDEQIEQLAVAYAAAKAASHREAHS